MIENEDNLYEHIAAKWLASRTDDDDADDDDQDVYRVNEFNKLQKLF